MKICILGNSHAASIKQGWDDISSSHSNFQLTFFAARGGKLRSLKLERGKLIAQTKALTKDIAFTSGGIESIDLDSYDVFLIYGLSLRVPSLKLYYSNAVMKQACLDVFSKSINIELCNLIRKESTKPIFIGHNPQVSNTVPKPESLTNKLTYFQAIDLLNEELDIDNAIIVSQPQETLLDQWFTHQKFSIGSTRLDLGDKQSNQPHQEVDSTHMNKEFGRLWLKNFFHIFDGKELKE